MNQDQNQRRRRLSMRMQMHKSMCGARCGVVENKLTTTIILTPLQPSTTTMTTSPRHLIAHSKIKRQYIIFRRWATTNYNTTPEGPVPPLFPFVASISVNLKEIPREDRQFDELFRYSYSIACFAFPLRRSATSIKSYGSLIFAIRKHWKLPMHLKYFFPVLIELWKVCFRL